MSRNMRLRLMLIGYLFMVLSCKMPFAESTKPASPIPVTTHAVSDLKDNIEAAFEKAKTSGQVDLIITEAQLTSLVFYELQSLTEAKISDPQIFLRDNQIQFYSTIEQTGLKLPMEIFATVKPDSSGWFEIVLTTAKIGGLPLPDEMITQIISEFQKVIASQIRSSLGELYIEQININDGQMHIFGHLQ